MSLKNLKNNISKALLATRIKVKNLEDSLSKRSHKIDELEKEIDKLRIENERLKDQIKKLQKAPDWAKPNTHRGKKESPKSIGHSRPFFK